MAAGSLAIRSRALPSPSIMQLSSLSRRSLSTQSQLSARSPLLSSTRSSCRAIPRQQSSPFQRVARRSYGDDAASATPAPKPKKRFRFLRWTWRLTWLTGVGLTGILAYSIFHLRHPAEQIEPDPSKKTLVILGGFAFVYVLTLYKHLLTHYSLLQVPVGAPFPY